MTARQQAIPLPIPRASLIKMPSQRRSIRMIHRIIDAAVVVLARDGNVGFSTHSVAAEARISVGSLYQYFASKEMIVSAIIERGVLYAEVLMSQLFQQMVDKPVEQVLDRAIDASNRAVDPYRAALPELLSVTPVLTETGLPALLRRPFVNIASEYFQRNADRYEVIGGGVTIGVATDLLTFAMLRRWSDPAPLMTDHDYFGALKAMLLSQVRKRTMP